MYRDNYYPFYMNFQNPEFWDEERMMERENQLMRSFYPRTARMVQEKVEAECDRMDYPGSFIYDEYPDRFMMEQVCRRIRMSLDQEMQWDEDARNDMNAGRTMDGRNDMNMGIPMDMDSRTGLDNMPEMETEEWGRDGRRRDDGRRDGRRHDRRGNDRGRRGEGHLDDLIRVLLLQEMRRRRCRNNRCRRFF